MKNTICNCIALWICLAIPMVSEAQIDMPATSPAAKISQRVGLANVSIAYSRPSVRNRKIFGELVPYGEVWRTGANASTKITLDDRMIIEGQELAAGEYAIYTIPKPNEWTVIFSKNLKNWGAFGYKPEEDALRFTIKPDVSPTNVENFTVNFSDLSAKGAKIELLWEKTIVRFSIQTDPDAKVMAQIAERTSPKKDASTYAQAARYYFDNNKDLKQALDWINKSIAADSQYYTLALKAKIEQRLGDCKSAIKTAELSTLEAQKAGNKDYVKENQQLIQECNAKK